MALLLTVRPKSLLTDVNKYRPTIPDNLWCFACQDFTKFNVDITAVAIVFFKRFVAFPSLRLFSFGD